MFHDFRKRLRNGERLYGTIVTIPSPAVAEILADVGFDWLFIDGEHGPLDVSQILSILQAVDDRIPCIVRVPVADEVYIKRVLDLGAAGIIAPQVNTKETATAIVNAARYAPDGARGVGLARAHGYGMGFQDYMQNANEQTTVIVQAEHALGVANIESIAEVPGIDAVLLGPYDLAASLGKMGDVSDPLVIEAIDRVTTVCRTTGIALGYFGITAEAVHPYVELDYNLIIAGTDTLFLGAAAGKTLKALREMQPT
ncbi:MAG: aldolase/citrate lyase family protein [Fuerstiella sp.]|nr:aldolase/citrate lyase family protein [Fuerstiella sp.]